MNKLYGLLAGIVVLIIVIAVFAPGILPLGLLENGTDTKRYTVEELMGCRGVELLQPHDKTGYICSWKNDGFSETISVRGKLGQKDGGNVFAWLSPSKYKYVVKLKQNPWSGYITRSKPGETSMYISNPNPGVMTYTSQTLQTYDFEIVGNHYADGCIKVELWAYYDKSMWDTEGYKWYLMASDEAYLYQGYGGLYLPTGITEEGLELPYDTFEIGQTVKIGVETAKGGASGNQKNWRVTLNEPYAGSITKHDSGGGVILEKYYPDDCDPSNTFFEFTVTADMAEKSMNSPHPYSIRIWNTILPLGTLHVDFVDFIKKCPGYVTFTGLGNKIEVGKTASVKINADVNPETQADIDYFRVSVIYGKSDTLLPGDWSDGRWIIHTSNVGVADKKACNTPQTISFQATKESYVTVFAKAFDVQGRPSKVTKTYTVWAWKPSSSGGGGEPPDEAVDDETGEDYYGGGHTDPWEPWNPGGGNWDDLDNDGTPDKVINFIIAIILFALCAVIAMFFPIPFGIYGKGILIVVGLLVAIIIVIFVPPIVF